MHSTSVLSLALMGALPSVAARPMVPSSVSCESATASASAWASITIQASSTPTSTPGSGAVFSYPLADGFPTPSQSQIAQVEQQAMGQLPNGSPPPSLSPESELGLALIAFNELFEVAFFTELLQNITSQTPGYTPAEVGADLQEVTNTITAVVAQEQLHELNANGAFAHFTNQTVQPCKYAFPVDNFHDAIALASTFTDVVLATLPDIQTILGENNDSGVIRGIGAVIGQEGEQNGFYRHLLGKLPPALPFLTGGALDFAFNAILQNFVVPGSCPSLNLLTSRGLQQFDMLNVETTGLALQDVTADFSLTVAPGSSESVQSALQGNSNLFLTYINQQNTPISYPIQASAANVQNGAVQFSAPWPGQSADLNGLTIVAVTKGENFTSPDAVAAATLFGPGLVEV